MSRADELARQREALKERAAGQRLAVAASVAVLRERVSSLRTLLGAAGMLAGAARAWWRRWRQERAQAAAAKAAASAASAAAPGGGPASAAGAVREDPAGPAT